MNITLIGMPGAGKSFVGRSLAEKINFYFIELDKIIEEMYGLPLPTIVEKFGEGDFLDKESAVVIGETNISDNLVVSPGGSVVYREASMKHLKKISKIIYLKVPQSVLEDRVGDAPRGIIGIGARSFSELYAERTVLYEKWSDEIVNGNEHVDVVVEDIIRKIST